jgi:hypothetical protein
MKGKTVGKDLTEIETHTERQLEYANIDLRNCN